MAKSAYQRSQRRLPHIIYTNLEGWYKYVTDKSVVLVIDRFGESVSGEEVMQECGFTVESVVKSDKTLLAEKSKT